MKLIGGNLLILLLLLLVADIVARVIIRDKHYTLFEDTDLFVSDREFIVDHPVRGFELHKGFRNQQVRINRRGFRGPELPNDFSRRVRIVALGESTTFGWNVVDDECYPAQLQVYLDEHADEPVWVVNAGVPSYTSLQANLYLDELLETLDPQVVLINIMWNDIWYSSIKNWFPEMLVLRKPKPWRTFLLKRSALYAAFALRADEEGGDVDVLNREALTFYEEQLDEMVAKCKSAGVDVAIVRPPFDASHIDDARSPISGESHFSKGFIIELQQLYADAQRRVAQRYQIPLVDHRLSADSLEQNDLFIDPVHPTAAGNRMIAEDIGRFLVEDVLAGVGAHDS